MYLIYVNGQIMFSIIWFRLGSCALIICFFQVCVVYIF